jgi:hypothetical protein
MRYCLFIVACTNIVGVIIYIIDPLTKTILYLDSWLQGLGE